MAFSIFAIIHSMISPWATPFQTLQAILTQANLPIRDESKPPKNMPLDRTAAHTSSFEVSNWTEFNFETLMEAYGDILSEQVQAMSHAPTGLPSIRRLADLKTVGQTYLFPTLQYTLDAGARHIGIRLGHHLPRFEFLPSQPLGGLRPAFTLSSDSQDILVVSCVQFAKQWNSSDLLDTSGSAKHPIGRLVTYCKAAGTRYGFVLTSSEVVVVRVSMVASSRNFHVEWQAIPWGASGEQTLTVNLGLWFLAMMSLNGDHRRLCCLTELVPLNVWSRSVDSDGRIVYQHHLSMRKRFDLPAGGVYAEA
ncbi:hypothetical protein N0V84_002193 [Fusarium piperis]|uniref:Uncharacterized protein n=1 Tax=Fusarium piperis TaxID=1435070 RepID=A0A9W9BSD9_9HYPO|nr:hypothetical protein N0V84_002193 [Fusarium piperis]